MTVSPGLSEGYDKADIMMGSPVGEKVFRFQVQPRRLRPVSKNVFSGFSHSPFFESACLTIRLHSGARVVVFINSKGCGHGN